MKRKKILGLMHKTAQNLNLYLLAKIKAAEFNWLILANQIQSTWSGMSIKCSSRKNY